MRKWLARAEPGCKAQSGCCGICWKPKYSIDISAPFVTSYQTAQFPAHRDLAGFDFESAKVDRSLIDQLAGIPFTDAAHNVVFVGGTGTGKTHLATALGVKTITDHGKRVRFYSTIHLVRLLEREKAAGNQGKLAFRLM